jgi:cytochrome c553
VVSVAAAAGSAPALDPGAEFFEAKVRPVLVQHCYACHGPEKQKGGLRLDTRAGVTAGGDGGPVVVPGKPGASRLVVAVRHTDPDLKMPPDKPLGKEQVAALEKWVELGAPDPRTAPAGPAADTADWDAVLRDRRTWWSLQPVRKPPLPAGPDANPVDRFVRSKLTAAGLAPAPPADRTTLARRLSFVLTGLPPTPEQVAAFEADPSPTAHERYVDSLLASPHFGERWARHWLDVARYADTYGYEWDIPAKGGWRYRDYLIRAFNADVPYDQLVREQIAGDLLPTPRLDPAGGTTESLVGPMFFMLGEKRHGDSAMFNGIHQEMLHDKIDAFSKAFQAVTVGCARCHDHKLDAVSQQDYYALAGILMSARWATTTTDTPERNRAAITRLKELKRDLRREVGRWWLEAEVADGWKKLPGEAALPVEHPLHPWQALVQATRDQKDVAARWKELAARYAKLGADRAAANARDFPVVADFTRGIPAGWSVDGVGLRDGPGRGGDFTVALTGPRIVGRLLPAGLFTDPLSPRLNGVVRTPLLRRFDRPWLSAHVAGGDFSAERVVVDNAFLAERQAYLAGPDPGWRKVSAFPEMKDRRVYVEYATKSSNPNFPPRVGLGGACSEEQAADPASWFGLTRVVAHAAAGAPADELAGFRPLFAGDTPLSLEDAEARYAAWFSQAVTAWAGDTAADEQAKLLAWLLQQKLLPNGEGGAPPKPVAGLLAAYRAAEKHLLDPQTVNGLIDADPAEDYRLNARGDFDRPTHPVPRGYLRVFDRVKVAGTASGRRDLAEYVASADNPLTARVYVNRVWHWVFGTGLVETPDDFGKLGDRPSHPELLDYLAAWFVENGWSTKKLIRLLVTSRTFRQSGAASAAALKADPRNRLLHHVALRRLEAEPIRDAILATSGRLDHQLFGPPLNPYRTHEDAQKRLFSGPLNGAGRRSVYTKVTIMEPPKFLVVFNQPQIPTGKRDVTNVPAQALALLNDPFVIGQAAHWGNALAKTPHRTVEERLRAMFRRALGRFPTAAEVTRWSATVTELAGDHGVPADAVLSSPAVWKDVAHTLFNTKEFIYVR